MDWKIGFVLGCLFAFILTSLFQSTLMTKKQRKNQTNNPVTRKLRERLVMSNAVDFRLSMGPSIVVLGGGTGLASLLTGLKCFTRNITAVVTVTDEGGSSGRLRQEWGLLPPGDIRNCVVALAENDNELSQILDFRFDKGELKGHSLGNLILLAVTELAGDFRLGVDKMNNLLAIRGRVVPMTTEPVSLAARTCSGDMVRGELRISRIGSEIEEIWLEPRDANPEREVLRAIEEADLIVLGPGSLFTSVIPNLLLEKVSDRLCSSRVPVVYVSNLMTQPGETDDFNILDHINWISRSMGRNPDSVIVNDGIIPEDVLSIYNEQGASPLYLDNGQVRDLETKGISVIGAELFKISEEGVLRHNGLSLSEILMKICRENSEVL